MQKTGGSGVVKYMKLCKTKGQKRPNIWLMNMREK
jgi:hypothetical protein